MRLFASILILGALAVAGCSTPHGPRDHFLGSLEYACAVAGAKLILVMGHSNCGAIKSACDHVELGNITGLLAKVQPAVSGVPNVPGDRNSKNPAFVEAVAERNVGLMIHRIRAESPILAQLEQEGTIAIAGSMYDVETGRVRLLQP